MKTLAPAIFLGHGSPMNILENNLFVQNFKKLTPFLNEFKGIVCLSAHYQTEGLCLVADEFPKTIHDYYGFPKELYDLNYPVKNSPIIVEEIIQLLNEEKLLKSFDWGLDHGVWHPLWHVLPNATIPVIPLSINFAWNYSEHYEFGKKLLKLRENGYIVMGSGNVVHSFKGIDFKNQSPPHSQALEFEKYVRSNIQNRSFEKLIQIDLDYLNAARFSINSSEHYLPILSILGSLKNDEKIQIFNDRIIYSTLSMLSFTTELKSTINFE